MLAGLISGIGLSPNPGRARNYVKRIQTHAIWLTSWAVKQYNFSTCGSWEGNRRSDVALAMRRRQSGITTYGLTALGRQMNIPPTVQEGSAHPNGRHKSRWRNARFRCSRTVHISLSEIRRGPARWRWRQIACRWVPCSWPSVSRQRTSAASGPLETLPTGTNRRWSAIDNLCYFQCLKWSKKEAGSPAIRGRLPLYRFFFVWKWCFGALWVVSDVI